MKDNRQMRYSLSLFALFLFVFAAPKLSYCQMIVGHRGASHDAPENTLAAFQEAFAQQADGIEGDFYLTKDSKIVCIHDKNTKRTGNKNLDVASSTLEQLRELEVGKWKDEKFRGEKIPTFVEVLQSIPPGKTFVIELKIGPEIVPVLKSELENYGVNQRNLLIISFNVETVSACKRQLPACRVHWLTGYKRDKQSGAITPTVDKVANTLRKCEADGLGTQGDRSIVTPDFIETLRTAGMKEFHVWTVDDPSDAKYFQELGAVGITTNRPLFIRQALSKE